MSELSNQRSHFLFTVAAGGAGLALSGLRTADAAPLIAAAARLVGQPLPTMPVRQVSTDLLDTWRS